METSKVNQLLQGRLEFARQEDGLSIFYVQPQETRQDVETGARVVHIGRRNNRPTRCVLLLGETGAGKTTFINAVLNYLFGVEFGDSFRLQLKEEIKDGRRTTASQTDKITVYTIHYKEGMRHEYNFVLIDTPGLADTRGTQRQEHVQSYLEKFLISEDIGVDDLHCVGLVAKGTVNRDFTYQKAVLGEIMSLLGDTVPEITCILATYGVDKPKVDDVMTNAGIVFTTMFRFDNGVLYTPHTSEKDQAIIDCMRWKKMREHYDDFFSHLINARPVSNRVRREKKLFNTCKKNLVEGFELLATLIAKLHVEKKLYHEFELQEVENKEYLEKKKEKVRKNKMLENSGNGVYAHNCRKCLVTCHCCTGSLEGEVLAAAACGTGAIVAGATTGAILGEGVAVAGVAAVVSTEAAAVAAAAGGAVAASETAAVASVTAAIASNPAAWLGVAACGTFVVGAGLAVGTGYLIAKIVAKKKNSCNMDTKTKCTSKGCHHPLSDHIRGNMNITIETVTREIINENMKNLYDAAVAKKSEINTKINKAEKNILSHRRIISQNTVELMHHAMRIQEFTSQHSDYIESVTKEITKAIRLAGSAGMTQALEHVSVLQKAMEQLASCGAQEVLGQHKLVENLLLSVYNKGR